MTRQPVHFSEKAVLVHGFRVHVVGRDVIGTRHNQAAKLPLLARHAMQRLDIRGHSHQRDERGLSVIQQLAPRPLYRHRLDVASVSR